MSSNSGLPIILLVFSNETQKRSDGTNNDRYLNGLQAERIAIEQAIEEANKRLEEPVCELVVLEGKKANVQEIYDVFNAFQGRIAAFHFGGHADGYQLLLQSAEEEKPEVANAGGLVAFFRQQSNLKLIFLNGCETHRQAKEIYDMGIPAVIGTNCPIGDELAKDFAHRFYRSLAQGVSLEHAWNDALSIIQTKPGVELSLGKRGIDPTALILSEGKELSWDLHTQSFDWNLGSEAKNPLFGLPVPEEVPLEKLPEDPFRYLERYGKKDAEVFFGRGREIRQLFSLLISRQRTPLILFYGQSGVGKSSVLEAGLFPRLIARSAHLGNRIASGRRIPEKGLLGTLKEALAKALKPFSSESVETLMTWEVRQLVETHLATIEPSGEQPAQSANPFYQVPKLVILLDQAEEAYTRPMKEAGNSIQQEWTDLLEALAPVVLNPRYQADVKVILSFRKEYHPEIRSHCQRFGLTWEDVFLKPLDEQGIREVAMGIQSTERLRQKYRVAVQEYDADGQSLPASIAEDLMEDKYSAIAPILQIQLSELWDIEKTKDKGREFTYEKYKKIKRDGEGKLEKFFRQQMQKLWEKEDSLTPYVRAGLALDLLLFHTTEMGTATQCHPRDLYENYLGREDGQHERASKKELKALLDKLVDLRLLLRVDTGSTRLAHDTLAPYVRKAFASSELPGQRAARILESKIHFLADQPDERKKQRLSVLEEIRAVAAPGSAAAEAGPAFGERFHALGKKIENLAAAKADDSDPLRLEPADMRIIEEGKIGMRQWNEKEKQLVEHNRAIQHRVVRRKQNNRLAMVGLGIIMAGIVFWGLRNLAGIWERERSLSAYQYLTLADEEMEKGETDNALYYASQAFLYNFPNEVSHIQMRMVSRPEEAAEKPGTLVATDTIARPLEHLKLSPDGRAAISWGGGEAQFRGLGPEKSGWETLPIKDAQAITAAFSADGRRLGMALQSAENEGILLVWALDQEGQPLLALDTLPQAIRCMDFATSTERIALGTRDSTVLVWNYQAHIAEATLTHPIGIAVKSVTFSPNEKAIMAILENEEQYLWRFQEEWVTEPLYLNSHFGDFSLSGGLFVSKDIGAVLLYEFSEHTFPELKQRIRLPGRVIEGCRFNAEGDIIVQLAGPQAWVFGQNGAPKDLFEFTDTLQIIQQDVQRQGLYFLSRGGVLYHAPDGKSTPRRMEEWEARNGQPLLTGGPPAAILPFSEELSSWHSDLQQLFELARLLLVLAFVNFIAHFFFSFLLWEGLIDWLNDTIGFLNLGFWKTLITLALFSIAVFFLTVNTTDEFEAVSMLCLFGSLALAFNIAQMRKTYRQERYLAFYGWLALFLGWAVVFGRFAFEMDKYGIFDVDDLGGGIFLAVFVIGFFIPVLAIVHLIGRFFK